MPVTRNDEWKFKSAHIVTCPDCWKIHLEGASLEPSTSGFVSWTLLE